MTETEIIQRGQDAERLLANPLLQEAFEKVQDGIINSMANSPLGDKETHNRLVIALQILAQIEKRIKEVADTGKMTALQLKQKELFGLFK